MPEYPRWLLEPRPNVLLPWHAWGQGAGSFLCSYSNIQQGLWSSVCGRTPQASASLAVWEGAEMFWWQSWAAAHWSSPALLVVAVSLALSKAALSSGGCWVFGELWAKVKYSCRCLQHFCLSRHSTSHWQFSCYGSLLDKGQCRWWVQFLAQIWCAHTPASCCDKDFPSPG